MVTHTTSETIYPEVAANVSYIPYNSWSIRSERFCDVDESFILYSIWVEVQFVHWELKTVVSEFVVSKMKFGVGLTCYGVPKKRGMVYNELPLFETVVE